MQITPHKRLSSNGFTLAEICVAIAVCVVFATGVFATNQRLLIALKGQRETTAAIMMLQERMETMRGYTYSNLADSSYLYTNVVSKPTTSEAALGNLIETIKVIGYTASG